MSIKEFYNMIKNKKIVMLGAGISNNELAILLQCQGAEVTLSDCQTRENLGDICDEMESSGIKLRLGENYLDALEDAEIIFRAPGFYYNHCALVQARADHKIVTSETEVFFDTCPCPIYAVTGSDGKTTTTSIIAEFLRAQGKTVHLGGNIGRALLSTVENISRNDAAVVELSSFQLISMRRSPDVAVITNISPNHLDVHKDMNEYIRAKFNIILHQNSFAKTVLNLDDISAAKAEDIKALPEMVRGRAFYFSRKKTPENGTYLSEDGFLCAAQNGREKKLFHKDEIRIPGVHNIENYLAAIAAVYPEVDTENMRDAARSFHGVEHRMELVRNKNNVKWYNDSIATTPTRTTACLNGSDDNFILIAGGRDKKLSYDALALKILEKAKTLILIGESAPLLESAVQSAIRSNLKSEKNGFHIIHADSMERAVTEAQKLAKAGDSVALSPACASQDMYKNFEERGKHFKTLVKNIS